jgi:RND family efflux transporter MFP subunit
MPRSVSRELRDLALVSAVLAGAIGCQGLSDAEPSKKASGQSPGAATGIEVVRPERRTVQRTVGEPGELEACETTPIYAKIAGYVQKVNVDIGSEIKKGQVLAELWVPEVEADLQEKQAAVVQAVARKAQAEAAVKVAQAAVTSAEATVTEVQAGVKRADSDLTRWRQQYRRVEQLFNERAQTGSLLDETYNTLRSAEAACDEVRAKVKSAEAALNEARSGLEKARADVVSAAASIDVAKSEASHAQAMLGYARIEAPFDGIITRRDIDTGHLTKPGMDSPPLFVAARSAVVTITIDIPETYATDVNPGARALVKLQAMKGRIVEGKVTRTAWALDPKTRTIRAEIDIPNPGGNLRPGLYAFATVIVEEHKDVLTIPTTAVVKEKDKSYCVAVAGGKAVRRPIEVGLSDGTWTEVVSGLNDGEAVVKANAASLADGQPVEVIEPANPAASGGKP